MSYRYEKETRLDAVHFTIYLEDKNEPVGFLRVRNEDSPIIESQLTAFLAGVVSERKAQAPRIISG